MDVFQRLVVIHLCVVTGAARANVSNLITAILASVAAREPSTGKTNGGTDGKDGTHWEIMISRGFGRCCTYDQHE